MLKYLWKYARKCIFERNCEEKISWTLCGDLIEGKVKRNALRSIDLSVKYVMNFMKWENYKKVEELDINRKKKVISIKSVLDWRHYIIMIV